MRKVDVFLVVALSAIPFSQGVAAMSRYATSYCDAPGFYCIKVHGGQNWENLFPDENQRELVMRLNRMNVPLHRGLTLAVPNNLEQVSLMELSPFAQQIAPPGRKLIYVDPKKNAWGAYDAQGGLVRWGPASTGRDWCSDLGQACHSPSGTFQVYNKGGDGCISSKFPIPEGGAPMPYCMFFHGGYALHGSANVPGYNASHGCVRLFYDDAEWLNQEFIGPGSKQGTKVIVASYYRGDSDEQVSYSEQTETE